MKKIKYFLASFLLIVLITPSVSLASWWNPLSWFENEAKTEISTETSSSTPPVMIETEIKSNWWNPFSWGKKETNIIQKTPSRQEQATTTEEIVPEKENSETENKDAEERANLELKTAKAKAEAEKYKLQTEQTKLKVEKLKQENISQTQIKEKVIEVPSQVLIKTIKELSNSEIIEKTKPSLVYIETIDNSGSGFIIENDGYILTNAHIVKGVNTAKIKLSNGVLTLGKIIGRDEKIDIALLKIEKADLFPAELGNSDTNALKQGDEVFTYGYSFGFDEDGSFKQGILSRRLTSDNISYLEITAEIQHGNSGGPLLNKFGQVVGINTLAIRDGGLDPLKFALPINLIRDLILELKSGRNIVLPNSEVISTSNSILCNGSYWKPCPSEQIFNCPTNGEPSCIAEDSVFCGDEYWSSCSSGNKFVCPTSGKAYCEEEENQKELQQEQEEINKENTLLQEAIAKMEILTSEYTKNITIIDEKIIAIKSKYYEDVEKAEAVTGLSSIRIPRLQKLFDDVNWEIQKLLTEKESLTIEYSNNLKVIKESTKQTFNNTVNVVTEIDTEEIKIKPLFTTREVYLHFDTNDAWSYGNANAKCNLNLTENSTPDGGIPTYSAVQSEWPLSPKQVFSWFMLNIGNNTPLTGISLKSVKITNIGTANLESIGIEATVGSGVSVENNKLTIVNLTSNDAEFSADSNLAWPFQINFVFNPNGMMLGETLGIAITEIILISDDDMDEIKFTDTFPVQNGSPKLATKCERK